MNSKSHRDIVVRKNNMEPGDRIVARHGLILDCQCRAYHYVHAHTLYHGETGRPGVMGPPYEENLPHREIDVPESRKSVQTLTNVNCRCKVYCTCEEVSLCINCRMMNSHVHVTSTGPPGEIGPVGFPGQYTDEMTKEYLRSYKEKTDNDDPIVVIENCKWCRTYGDSIPHHHALYQGKRGCRGPKGHGRDKDYYL